MKKQPLKIGFDLDGVILYNPARIARPIVAAIKNIFSRKKTLKFYFPQTRFEKFMWHLFHKSSIFVAPGFNEIKEMAKKGEIEAYLITGRYSFLKNDLEKWIKKADIHNIFKGYFYNEKDEQPHLFKERMVKKLNLDIFVEDNWDIVRHLAQNSKNKIFWIYNIFDNKLPHTHKFPSLKKVTEEIKKYI